MVKVSKNVSFMDPYSADDIERRRGGGFLPRKASEKIFQPLTAEFEVIGTEYRVQLGKIAGLWASVLLIDDKVISAGVYKKEKLSKLGFPNLYHVVGWLLRTVIMLEVNPRDLLKLIGRMIGQLIDNRDRGIAVNYAALHIDPYLVDDLERGKDYSFIPKKSSERDFKPLSNQLGIPGTSYRIELGRINGKWASRLLKGNSETESYVYKDEDLSSAGFPNQNLIVGWVLRTVAIPNINPHQIMKITQALTKQAIKNRGDKVDGDDFFPTPYIFKPPDSPDDIGVATNVQLIKLAKEEVADVKLFCRYCGSELSMDERYCSVCGKKS